MDEIRNICIIGAGNVGIACAVDFSLNYECNISVLSSKANTLSSSFKIVDTDTNEKRIGKKIAITYDYKKALEDADLVVITVPSFCVEAVIEKVSNYNPKIILFTPGYGGKERYCQKLMQKGCAITGFDRSPYICILSEPTVVSASKKTKIRVGCLNTNHSQELCDLYESLFGFEVELLPNYLTVALTPSNPVLHTSRLYAMFKDSSLSTPFSRIIKFYAEWNDESSEVMLKIDAELQNLCRKIEIVEHVDLSKVLPLSVHYESPTVKAMTEKISHIKSFQNINSPLIKKGEQYYIDSDSRYFKEDFDFGLAILQQYGKKYEIPTPMMDIVMDWYTKNFCSRIDKC